MPKQYSSAPCSVEELRARIHYDPATGGFTARVRLAQRVAAGQSVGSINPRGYVVLSIGGKQYLGHRVAWFIHHGVWPGMEIDHINGVRHDNRIANLREAHPDTEQPQNKRRYSNNRSGFPGVIQRGKNSFRAYIQAQRVYHHLGTFSTAERAYEAYLDAKRRLHPFQPTPRSDA